MTTHFLVSQLTDSEIDVLYTAASQHVDNPTFWDAEIEDMDEDWVVAKIKGRSVMLHVSEVWTGLGVGDQGVLICSHDAAIDAELM